MNSAPVLNKMSKKEARAIVYNKLTDALAEFKLVLKKKKFENNLLKATKLFGDDIAKSSINNKAKVKKTNRRKATKKAAEPVADNKSPE
jgi:hypothetical protein